MDGDMLLPEQPQPGAVYTPRVYVRDEPVWEYRRVARHMGESGAPTQDELTELGKEGWELAGILNHAHFVYFYFKRRVK